MLTLDQLHTILASDEPTDMWLLQEDGTITAEPEDPNKPLDDYLRADTYPRYLCRSKAIEQLVSAMGEKRALQQVNMMINTVVAPKPSPKLLAQRVAQALKSKDTP